MTEEWRPVEGFEGYEVSDLGRVRCWRPLGAGQPPSEPRLLKPKVQRRSPYPRVILGKYGPTKCVHRLVAEAFVPGMSEGLEVAHINGIRHDNRVENLAWKTRRDNHADKKRHGTNGRKLTFDQAREIRAIYATGELSQQKVGEMFGVGAHAVNRIVRNLNWKEIA